VFAFFPGVENMALTIEAVYANGVLKPSQPLPLPEHERVQVTIQSLTSPLLASYGIMGFTGSAAEADHYALDPDLDHPTPPEDA
jgi:predicted DNA-binding antitoxin AbrB/MazE fold protein